jgi:hypothetical protein
MDNHAACIPPRDHHDGRRHHGDITIQVPPSQMLPGDDAVQSTPAALSKRWVDLSPDERALADSLGFDEASWAVDEAPTAASLSRNNSSNLHRTGSTPTSSSAARPESVCAGGGGVSALVRSGSFGVLVRSRSGLTRHISCADSALSSSVNGADIIADEMRANLLETVPALSVEDVDQIVQGIFQDPNETEELVAQPDIMSEAAVTSSSEESYVVIHLPPDCSAQFHVSVRVSLMTNTLADLMYKVEKQCGIPAVEQIYTRDIYGRELISGQGSSCLAELGIAGNDLLYLTRVASDTELSLAETRSSEPVHPHQRKINEYSTVKNAQPTAIRQKPAIGTGYAIDNIQSASTTATEPQLHSGTLVPAHIESKLCAMDVQELKTWVSELGLEDLACDIERHGINGLTCFGEMQAQADWTWMDLHAFLCSLGLQPSAEATKLLHAAIQDSLCTDRGMMLLVLATRALGKTIEVEFSEEGKLGLTFQASEGKASGPTRIAKLDLNGAAAHRHPQLQPGMVLVAVQEQPLAGQTHANAMTTLRAAGRPIKLTFLAMPGSDTSRDLVAARRFATAALHELQTVKGVRGTVGELRSSWGSWSGVVVHDLHNMVASIDFHLADYASCVAHTTVALIYKPACTIALQWRGLAAVKMCQWALAQQDWLALAAAGIHVAFALDQLGIVRNALTNKSAAQICHDGEHEQRLLAAVRNTQRKLDTSLKDLQAAETRIRSQQQEVDQTMRAAAMTKHQKDLAERQIQAGRADAERQQMEITTLRQQLEIVQKRSQLTAGTDHGLVYPEHWELGDRDKNLELKDVARGTDEWNTVAGRFETAEREGWRMVRVRRIQNRYLWRYCQYEKSRMCELRPDAGEITTQQLWHGTGPTDPREIYMGQEGFDVRYSRPGLWGRGIYFAKSALYSASGYAHPPIGPNRHYRGCIILAEVLTGDSYRCAPGTYRENKPPTKRLPRSRSSDVASSLTFDSCTGYTGNTGGSEVFVVYNNFRAYPSYLVDFVDDPVHAVGRAAGAGAGTTTTAARPQHKPLYSLRNIVPWTIFLACCVALVLIVLPTSGDSEYPPSDETNEASEVDQGDLGLCTNPDLLSLHNESQSWWQAHSICHAAGGHVASASSIATVANLTNMTMSWAMNSDTSRNIICTFDIDGSPTCGWTQAGERKWKRGTQTPSSDTGANEAAGGKHFMFLETSNGRAGDVSYLTSPVFTRKMTSLSFYYHMHGSAIGDLSVEARVSDIWTEIWHKSGEQHASQTDSWSSAIVSMPNATERVRFKGTKGTSSAKGDISIDSVALEDSLACAVVGRDGRHRNQSGICSARLPFVCAICQIEQWKPTRGARLDSVIHPALIVSGSCFFDGMYLFQPSFDGSLRYSQGNLQLVPNSDSSWQVTQVTRASYGSTCIDINNGAMDDDGDDCSGYGKSPSWCGNHDDDDFTSSAMCCACGGGQRDGHKLDMSATLWAGLTAQQERCSQQWHEGTSIITLQQAPSSMEQCNALSRRVAAVQSDLMMSVNAQWETTQCVSQNRSNGTILDAHSGRNVTGGKAGRQNHTGVVMNTTTPPIPSISHTTLPVGWRCQSNVCVARSRAAAAMVCTFDIDGSPTCGWTQAGERKWKRGTCYMGDGAGYSGTASTTVSGLTCQQWALDTPHSHRFNDLPANHCRNPDGEPMPWCYTTDPSTRWAFCDIPQCQTPSSDTGANEAAGGKHFMFLETSNGRAGDVSYLTSPVFTRKMTSLSFYYHMHGSAIGDLSVEARVSDIWTEIWHKSGEQHASQTDSWSSAIVSMPNATERVRFKGTKGTSSAKGDISIDTILVHERGQNHTTAADTGQRRRSSPGKDDDDDDDDGLKDAIRVLAVVAVIFGGVAWMFVSGENGPGQWPPVPFRDCMTPCTFRC